MSIFTDIFRIASCSSFIIVGNIFLALSSDAQTILNIKDQNNRENFQSSSFTLSDRPIKIEKIEVSGNTLFKTEIERLTEKFQGKAVTLSELHELRSSISKLYVDKGYVNSGAYLPPQKIQNGVVKIEVLEGGIETIEVTGNKHLSDRYITSRLKSLPTPIKTEQLLERLQLLRLDPLIENISAELSSGLTPGMSRLDIEVKEADNFTLSSSLDNHKSPSIGSNSRNIGIAHANLLGFGDRARLNYTNTEGSNGLDFGYAFPINAKNGQISLAYGFNSNDIVENPFTPLDIETKSNYYELSLRQPIIIKPSQELALGMSFSRQHSETSLLDLPFPLSTGADESGNTTISALRFFQEFTQRSDKSVFALRSQFSVGVDLFDATTNNNAPDSKFFAWRGQSQWARQLDDDFVFLVRGDIQLADNLVPLEQFRLGGATSVRGYRRDSSLSDRGLFASAELRVPVLRIDKLDGVVQLVPFFDLGFPWQGENTGVEIDSLASLGMGLNFNAGDKFNARLDYGIPLTDTKADGDSLQENGVTFSLGYSF
jgi:hemolysin activation/secretion protein